MYLIPNIGLGVRVFANGPGVIPKTQKMVLDASLLNTQHYKVRIKGKVEQSREGVAPSPTHWCSSYRKGSLRVTLDYGRQLYFLHVLEPLHSKYSGNPQPDEVHCHTLDTPFFAEVLLRPQMIDNSRPYQSWDRDTEIDREI